ncbi:MAG TPA: NifU family protein [Conexibacter sp.]|jgi:Fe-S cluster biogenesis protein NfuA
MAARDEQATECVERVERALDALDALRDPAAVDAGLEVAQALLEMYGEGFARVIAGVGESAVERLAGDELIAHLLLLHGLHPVGLEARVEAALEEVRPFLASHGGGAALVEVADGVAHVRLQGTCDGCPSSAVTLQHAVEEAVRRAAPEVERVEAEGTMPVAPAPPFGDSPFGALPMAHSAPSGPACPATEKGRG